MKQLCLILFSLILPFIGFSQAFNVISCKASKDSANIHSKRYDAIFFNNRTLSCWVYTYHDFNTNSFDLALLHGVAILYQEPTALCYNDVADSAILDDFGITRDTFFSRLIAEGDSMDSIGFKCAYYGASIFLPVLRDSIDEFYPWQFLLISSPGVIKGKVSLWADFTIDTNGAGRVVNYYEQHNDGPLVLAPIGEFNRKQIELPGLTPATLNGEKVEQTVRVFIKSIVPVSAEELKKAIDIEGVLKDD